VPHSSALFLFRLTANPDFSFSEDAPADAAGRRVNSKDISRKSGNSLRRRYPEAPSIRPAAFSTSDSNPCVLIQFFPPCGNLLCLPALQ
jgi:hypothetical protein